MEPTTTTTTTPGPTPTPPGPTLEEALLVLRLQRGILCGGICFFSSFAMWILWRISTGDPFARILGPVVVMLLLSIMSMCFVWALWRISAEGYQAAVDDAARRVPGPDSVSSP